MDMATYLKQAAPEEREVLAQRAGTSVGYLYLIAGGHRRASPKLCKALNAANPRLTLAELRPDVWGEAGPVGDAQPLDVPRRRKDDQVELQREQAASPGAHAG